MIPAREVVIMSSTSLRSSQRTMREMIEDEDALTKAGIEDTTLHIDDDEFNHVISSTFRAENDDDDSPRGRFWTTH